MSSFASFSQFIRHGGQASIILSLCATELPLELKQSPLDRSAVDAFEQHLRLHEEFAAQVADFLGNGESWTEDRVQELRRFLNKWLIGHIMTHDLRFGKWHASHHAPIAHAVPVQKTLASIGFFARLFGARK